jgi:hypothetical protein
MADKFTKLHEFLIFVVLPGIAAMVVGVIAHVSVAWCFLIAVPSIMALVHLIMVWSSRGLGLRILLSITLCSIYGWGWVELTQLETGNRLEQERRDVDEKLDISATLPTEKNILGSSFTVTNNSSRGISENNQIICVPNYITFWDDGHVIGGASIVRRFPSPLLPNGDAKSDQCFHKTFGGVFVTCADVTVIFKYQLVSQPGTELTKQARFVANRDDDYAGWHKQPVSSREQFCKPFDDLREPSR